MSAEHSWSLSPRMLRFPYHTRYELIEFAVFTLAARAQRLVAMHGACVGRAGRGVLLLGPSGAGKSTVTLQCLLEGLEILAEDSVFVTPDTLLAGGVSNFLHVRADSLRWIAAAPHGRENPSIAGHSAPQRRAKVRDRPACRQVSAGRAPIENRRHRILVRTKVGRGRPLLKRLPRKEALPMLVHEQAYAANQPPWAAFIRSVKRLPFFELRRGQHPSESVAVLRELIEPPSRAIR